MVIKCKLCDQRVHVSSICRKMRAGYMFALRALRPSVCQDGWMNEWEAEYCWKFPGHIPKSWTLTQKDLIPNRWHSTLNLKLPNKVQTPLSTFPRLSLSILLISALLLELGGRKGMSVGASTLMMSGDLSTVSWANVLTVNCGKSCSGKTLTSRYNPQIILFFFYLFSCNNLNFTTLRTWEASLPPKGLKSEV